MHRLTAVISILSIALLAAACGARSTLQGEESTAAAADAGAGDAASGERHCPPECYVGHECCAESCAGPAVPMPSDCCTCLPGEVSSVECAGGKCAH